MRKELDEALCREFQSIFRERRGPPEETAMFWGVDCGDGWHGLVRAACLYAENVVKNERSNAVFEHKAKNGIAFELDLPAETLTELGIDRMAVVMEQVKEKYGTLRLYWRGEGLPERAHDEIAGAVGMVEYLSGLTCEKCGKPGELRGPGWLVTACDGCAKGRAIMREYEDWRNNREAQGLEISGKAWAERGTQLAAPLGKTLCQCGHGHEEHVWGDAACCTAIVKQRGLEEQETYCPCGEYVAADGGRAVKG